MHIQLSVIIITRNASDTLHQCLDSIASIADEIIIVDDYSTDRTAEIASEYNAFIYFHHEQNLGKQKHYALSKAHGTWVLSIDSDEVVSPELAHSIKNAISHDPPYTGYYIQYQNHFLGKPLKHGGEDYKMMRLFRREAVSIEPALIHEHFTVKHGSLRTLDGYMLHYSYRSIFQMYRKFTSYALREARQRSVRKERVTLRKLFIDPAHMFWARYVESGGYKDGAFRIPLDLGFAYMEFLMYVGLAVHSLFTVLSAGKKVLPV